EFPMPIDWFPLWLSLRVAGISTAIAIALGLWIAWVLANRAFRGKEVIDAAVTLPLVLPPTVLGYYLLVVLGRSSPLGKVYEWVVGQPLAFARALGDFGITLMIAGNIPGRTQTVALAIYDAVESGNGAMARTLVLVISAVALIILSVANRFATNPFGPRHTSI